MARAVIDDYRTSLEDLTFNSKPHINALTMLAEEYLPHADVIVRLIEAKLNKAPSNGKLPLMYLMDSIVKNVKKNYVPLFAENLVKSFNTTFDTGDEKTKISLYKLRSTWDSYFPLKTLYKLDVAVNNIDSAWPVKPLPASLQEKPSTSIHVNPKFLKKVDAVPVTSVAVDIPVTHDSVDLKQDLINKQKQLLDLQQQKLLLELEQTKQQLAMREKRNQLAAKKQPEAVSKDPRLKQAAASVAPTGLRVTVVTNGQKPQVRGNTKDPRNQTAAKNTHPPSAETKKQPATLDPRAKNVAIKKSPAEKPKIVKKSPNDTEKIKKKKVSPQTVKRLAKTSPKNFAKNEAKKTKISKKKTEVKTVKNTQSETVQQSKENIGQKGQTKHIDGEISKKRDRPGRRSPPRNQAPPAKLARRSTSIERRSPSSPIRRRLEHPKNASIQRSAAAREVEQIRRDSPMPSDGSISPRFSPEPDESPVKRNRNWRPPVKRIRHIQSPPESWQREEMPPRPSPPVRRRTSVDPNVRIPQELTLGHQAEILKQDLLISFIVFALVSFASLADFGFRAAWCIVFVVVFIIMGFVVYIVFNYVFNIGNVPGWVKGFSGWVPRHFLGVICLACPAAMVFSNMFCHSIGSPLPPDCATYLIIMGIVLIHFLNFNQLSSWIRSVIASIIAISITLLVYLNPCGERLVTTGNSTTNIITTNGLCLSEMSKYQYEFIIDILLLMLFIFIVNREYEVGHRLTFFIAHEAEESNKTMEEERNQMDQLLLHIIPPRVQEVIREKNMYSKNHENVGVIFASIINFNEFYEESYAGGKECIRVLNELIGDVDELLDNEKYAEVEKIKTIGSTFMIASGLNPNIEREPNNNNHLCTLMHFCTEVQDVIFEFNENMVCFTFILRIGFNHGSVTAGVIGTTKLLYDIWGDTVNIASRMDSTGVPGKIQVSENSQKCLKDKFDFTYRGSTMVKGKGEMQTYLLHRESDRPIKENPKPTPTNFEGQES